jgi:GntR family transcriptional regulator
MRLSIAILTGTNVPVYRQIVDQICAAVVSGRLGNDEPLPSVRTLAEQLVVNPNTVARAYGELVREGIVESHPGRGMFVARRRQIYSTAERNRRMEQAVTALLSEGFMLGFSPEEIIEHVAQKTRAQTSAKSGKSTNKGGAR